MAHELNFTNGKADMFSVLETPWHREGTVLNEAPTLADAMTLANLDYPVIKCATKIVLPTGEEIESGKAFVTIRGDSNVELGAVGTDYQPVQNRDAFRALEPLIDAGLLQLETGGVLREGADAWLLGKFNVEKFGPVVREVFADEVLPYALISTNHSGRRGVLVAPTPIRVVCANTLTVAEGGLTDDGRSQTVRHTGDAEARVIAAGERLFGGLVDRYEVVATAFRRLKGWYIDEHMLRSLVIEPAIGEHPTKRDSFNAESRAADTVIERYERRADEITRLWYEGAGHTGDSSAWEAYNGLVEAVDHNAVLFPTRGGGRVTSLVQGSLRTAKESALSALLAAAPTA